MFKEKHKVHQNHRPVIKFCIFFWNLADLMGNVYPSLWLWRNKYPCDFFNHSCLDMSGDWINSLHLRELSGWQGKRTASQGMLPWSFAFSSVFIFNLGHPVMDLDCRKPLERSGYASDLSTCLNLEVPAFNHLLLNSIIIFSGPWSCWKSSCDRASPQHNHKRTSSWRVSWDGVSCRDTSALDSWTKKNRLLGLDL